MSDDVSSIKLTALSLLLVFSKCVSPRVKDTEEGIVKCFVFILFDVGVWVVTPQLGRFPCFFFYLEFFPSLGIQSSKDLRRNALIPLEELWVMSESTHNLIRQRIHLVKTEIIIKYT